MCDGGPTHSKTAWLCIGHSETMARSKNVKTHMFHPVELHWHFVHKMGILVWGVVDCKSQTTVLILPVGVAMNNNANVKAEHSTLSLSWPQGPHANRLSPMPQG